MENWLLKIGKRFGCPGDGREGLDKLPDGYNKVYDRILIGKKNGDFLTTGPRLLVLVTDLRGVYDIIRNYE